MKPSNRKPTTTMEFLNLMNASLLWLLVGIGAICLLAFIIPVYGQKKLTPAKTEFLKKEAIAEVDKHSKMTQEMVDMIFSFSELGFQEFETMEYATAFLEKNGFKVEKGLAGIPTQWMATYGSGKPVITLGGDIDCIPKASQKPGVAYHDPIIEGAPGHGEGHNASVSVNFTAALVVKEIMEREGMQGTIKIIPGVAEEQLATKSYLIRDGLLADTDVAIFTHVGTNLQVSYGAQSGNGLVSVEFTFKGEAAHAARPWRGRSALDAVEMMNVGWNFQREHLFPTQRSHYVITNGGDQPNVVPSESSVWYYFREREYAGIKDMYEKAIKIAEGAALMTDTEMSYRILGSAWPQHYNKIIAEVTHENIKKVGLPIWSEADQTLAKALQKEVGSETSGLPTELEGLGLPSVFSLGGGSNDMGDITWSMPTIRIRFPSNIEGLQGHHWSNAVAMATPLSHKGATAGAKALALTMVDIFTKPEITVSAWDYYNNVQTKNTKFIPFIDENDKPAIHLNKEIMAEFRPQMEKFYYDPTKFATYLEQLGISYPTIRE